MCPDSVPPQRAEDCPLSERDLGGIRQSHGKSVRTAVPEVPFVYDLEGIEAGLLVFFVTVLDGG